jgi:hypothetical protein
MPVSDPGSGVRVGCERNPGVRKGCRNGSVTVTEIRYGALRAGWGELRLRRLERSLATTAVVLDLELVAGDGIFENVPALDVHRIRPA